MQLLSIDVKGMLLRQRILLLQINYRENVKKDNMKKAKKENKEIQKLAVELKALEKKKQVIRDAMIKNTKQRKISGYHAAVLEMTKKSTSPNASNASRLVQPTRRVL